MNTNIHVIHNTQNYQSQKKSQLQELHIHHTTPTWMKSCFQWMTN